MSCQSQSNPHNIDLNVLIAKYQELINLYNILKSKVSSQCCKKKTEWGNIIGDIYDQDDLITLIESLEVDCQDIKDCLGISNLGDPDKYLNEQGTWQAIDLTGTPTEILYYDNSGNIVSDNNFYRVTTGANPNTYIKSINNNSGGYSEIYAGSDYLALYNDLSGSGDGGYLYLQNTAKLGKITANNFGSYLEVNSTNFIYTNTNNGVTFVYPNVDGLNGHVLTTNGAGDLTFQPIPSTPQYITAIADTNTVDLTETAGTLTADINYQNTATINLSEDASGLKADFASMNISQFTNDSNYAVNTNPITQFSAFTHFTEIFPGIGAGGTGAGVWELGNGWVLARNSTAAVATPQPAEVDRPGIVRHSTGAINSYNQIRCGAIWVSSDPLLFKGHFRIQILSGGGQGFVISCGFSAGGTYAAPTDAIRIFLTDANVLQVEVIKSSVSLVVNTGITVAIDTHYDIVITKADTTNECQFYVNGVNVYSLTNPADIATYVPQNLSMECNNSFQKTGGTSARTFDTDFAYVTNNLPI